MLEVIKCDTCVLGGNSIRKMAIIALLVFNLIYFLYLIYLKFLKDAYISKFLNILNSKCGFRKRHSAQNFLIVLLDKWRNSLAQGLEFCILLTDLSKVFDCLLYDLFIANLAVYRFDNSALHFTYDYLRHRNQRTKIVNVIVHGRKYYIEFPKDRSWSRYCLM